MGRVTVQIENPWAACFPSALLARIRENSRTMARKGLAYLMEETAGTQGAIPQKTREGFEEIVFIAACRAGALDGGKPFSIELWAEHVKAVQAMVAERFQHQVPTRSLPTNRAPSAPKAEKD